MSYLGNFNKYNAEFGNIHNYKTMNFWEIVNSELEYKNIDRKELALKAGFNVSNISKGIRENNIPSADTAFRIAKVLGVSVEYLVTGKSPEFQNSGISEEIQVFHKNRILLKKLESLPKNQKEGIEILIDKLLERES